MKNEVPIYNNKGEVIQSLRFPCKLEYVDGRVCKGNDHYYKGVGIPYSHQYTLADPDSELFDNIVKHDVFYMGFTASKKCYQNKFGIFQEKYQPQFSDFIGTCGVKELAIIENSMLFELSSVDVIKSHNYDKENNQYYFELDYKCGRKKYLDHGNPVHLYELMEYMIKEHWNFIWDKKSITDVTHDGRVSDVGDLFYSKDVINKVGTVYSILYSLGKLNKKKYLQLNQYLSLQHDSDMCYISNTIEILKKFNVDVSDILKYDNKINNYKNAVYNYLISGRNCGHCSYLNEGERIKKLYYDQTINQIGPISK